MISGMKSDMYKCNITVCAQICSDIKTCKQIKYHTFQTFLIKRRSQNVLGTLIFGYKTKNLQGTF